MVWINCIPHKIRNYIAKARYKVEVGGVKEGDRQIEGRGWKGQSIKVKDMVRKEGGMGEEGFK